MATITASDQVSGTSAPGTLQSLTTTGVTPTGSDRAVYVTAAGAINGATANYWDEARYTNSSGGLINDYVGADQELSYFSFTEAYAKIRGEINPASGSSLPIYVHWPAGNHCAAVSVVFVDGADQTTPFGTEVVAGTGLTLASGTSVQAVTLAFTGLDPGQRVLGSLTIFCFGTNAIGSVAEGSGATSILEDVVPAAEEARQVRVVTATGVADGSGNITLDIDVTASSNDGFIWYTFNGNPVNDAAASGSTGTLATTNANDTSAASGTTTVTGTLARTNANDTSAASGTTTVTGTLARTNANDTLAASGEIGTEITGSLSTTNANDTSAASGTTTVVGTLARTNANDTSSAAGTTTVTGTLAATNADDSIVASGVAGAPTGTVAYTNANDTSSAQGETPQQTSGAPGGRPWIAYINGKRVYGSLYELRRLIEEFAEEQAEEAVETGKEVKKPRIVVQPGKAVAKMPEMSQEQGKAIQAEIRSSYNEAYIKAKIKYAEHEAEEEATMMVLLS